MFIIGAGSSRAPSRPGSDTAAGRQYSAAAWAAASDTPRMALAPRFFLFGVPSSSIICWSIADLIERVHADELVGDRFVDVVDGLRDAFAEEQLLVAVAQLPGFVDAGAGAAGDGGAAERAVGQRDVDLDGRIAAAIENLPAVDIDDRAHGELLPFLSLWVGRNLGVRLLQCKRLPEDDFGSKTRPMQRASERHFSKSINT